jgi:Sigma-54 interaction domain
MNNPLKVAAAPTPSADGARRVSQLREDWRAARTAHAELMALGMPRVNLIVTGQDGVIEYLLDALLPDLREPVGRWCPGEQLLLPPPALIGTMIFQDIGAMPYDDQCRLLKWLDGAAGRTQVVTTTSTPLIAQVARGSFIEALYYRLNIVCIDASV